MGTRRRLGRLALVAATSLAAAIPLLATIEGHAATGEALSVDLGATSRAATGVGEGFLYGVSQDGSQPADQFLQPLGMTAFRGGGHAAGGWIADGYRFGSATQADVTSAAAQARRFTRSPYHAQYQAILSDMYGADGGQPSTTMWPCDNGDCANWVSFIDAVVGALQGSGLTFAYDVWNEPDISAFWTRGMNSTQYFQMWDTAVKEIRRIAPGAQIVGPSIAFTPQQNAGEWQTWLSHVKAAGTLPDQITNHLESDGDDPVGVAQSINSDLSSAGISAIPLSANEFQPQNQQSAGQSAWYLARFAQSGYANAMRGNWACCLTPNLTGLLAQSGGSWAATGNWWVFRDYADLTGTLVATTGTGTTALAAAEDSANKRAVAIVGDQNGYTGAATVTFNRVSAQSWLAGSGTVNVVVQRIPDQSPLSSPQVVLNQTMTLSGGAVAVPLTFQASHDAFAIYLTPGSGTVSPSASASPSASPSASASATGGLACTAGYQVVSSWTGGFQATVTVTNSGTQASHGWTVTWTFLDGQVVSQAWNATTSQSGAAVTATNASYDGALNPGGTTSFGFIASWTGTNRPPATVTCRAS